TYFRNGLLSEYSNYVYATLVIMKYEIDTRYLNFWEFSSSSHSFKRLHNVVLLMPNCFAASIRFPLHCFNVCLIMVSSILLIVRGLAICDCFVGCLFAG